MYQKQDVVSNTLSDIVCNTKTTYFHVVEVNSTEFPKVLEHGGNLTKLNQTQATAVRECFRVSDTIVGPSADEIER